AVGAIALTVSDMDRSVAFYTSVLEFRQVADTVVTGDGYGRLEGVPGSRVRVVRLQLGDETLQLMAWLHPTGRPAPTGAHSNDRWFQHVAIIVSDMARAYAVLEAHGVGACRRRRSGSPIGTPTRAASAPSTSTIPMGIPSRSSSSRRAKVIRSGSAPTGGCSSGSTTQQSC